MNIFLKFVRLFSCYPNVVVISSAQTLFYGIPVYILLLIVLIKYRKIGPFDSIFYYLFTILGFIDILQITHLYFFVKLPSFGYLTEFFVKYANISIFKNRTHPTMDSPGSHVLPSYASLMVYGLAFLQYFGISLLSLNRFTCLAFPFSSRLEQVQLPVSIL